MLHYTSHLLKEHILTGLVVVTRMGEVFTSLVIARWVHSPNLPLVGSKAREGDRVVAIDKMREQNIMCKGNVRAVDRGLKAEGSLDPVSGV